MTPSAARVKVEKCLRGKVCQQGNMFRFLSNRAQRREFPMRTSNITNVRRNVFGYGQDRVVVTMGRWTDRAAQHLKAWPAAKRAARFVYALMCDALTCGGESATDRLSRSRLSLVLAGSQLCWQPARLLSQPTPRS